MNIDVQTEAVGQFNCFVGAVVVHQNADVHQVGDFPDRGLQGLLRVVSGHNYGDALAINHVMSGLQSSRCLPYLTVPAGMARY
jgi:hypothetical protein